MSDPDLTLRQFQKHIRQRYHETDSARGTPATFMWLMEEIGELATALHDVADASKPQADTRANLAEEFADVLAWLSTLANVNDVDLTDAIREKYLGDAPPQGTK